MMRKTLDPFVKGLLLAALSLSLYLPSAHHGFISLDDNRYIFENREVLRGLNWQTALWAVRTIEDANWYPLQRLSHLLDVSLFGMRAGGHHLLSAAWHAAAACMLFAALRLMTGFTGRSLAVAALFAVHPLQVEPVAWAAERGSVMAGFFFASTLLLWTRYVRRPGPGRYGTALFSFFLGLASKPTAAALPFLLLLLNWWPLGRCGVPSQAQWQGAWSRCRRLLPETIPFFALSALFLSIAVVAHRESRALKLDLSLGLRFGNAMISYWRYVGKLLWPVDQAAYYPHPGAEIRVFLAVVATLALAGCTLALVRWSSRRPWLGVGWLWFLGMLSPMIGIVQFGSHALADRFAYLSVAGFFIALVWLLAEEFPPLKYRAALLAAGATAILMILGSASVRYLALWRNSEPLFKHTLAVTSRNWLIQNNLGIVLNEANRQEEAVGHFREALRLRPDYADAHQNLGIALAGLNRSEEAMLHYREAIRLEPGIPEPYNNLAILLFGTGRNEQAMALYRVALKLRPDFPDAHNNLGIALARAGHVAEGILHLEEALRLRPGKPDYQMNLALARSLASRERNRVGPATRGSTEGTAR